MSDWFQVAALAILQGLTEFLPVSSSAHLILLPIFTGWQDQGILMDVSVHFGTLIAVVLYFRHDLKLITIAFIDFLRGKGLTPYGHMGLQLILATIPVCIAGVFLHDFVATHGRSMLLIAATTLIFGGLLWLSAGYSKASQHQVTYKHAIWMGLAQTLALIPGTSRSGVTLTTALFLGLSKQTAARFAFMMAIPVISAAMTFETVKLIKEPMTQPWSHLILGIGFSALFAWGCIHYFLKLIDKIGLLPFVIYRLGLGCLLLVIFFWSA